MYKLFLLLNPVYATLFWAVVLNTVKQRGNEPKVFLGKFFVVAFLVFVCHLLYFIPLPEIYVHTDSIYYLTHLLVFPLYYIYIRLLSVDYEFSIKKHYKYLIVPFVLFVFYKVGVFFMTKTDHIDFVYDNIIKSEGSKGIFFYQKIVTLIIRFVFFVQGIVYMTLSILSIKRNRERFIIFYSNDEENLLRKVQWLNLTVSITMSTSIIMEVLGKIAFTGNDFFLLAPSAIFTVMLFCIGWLGNSQTEALMKDMPNTEDNTDDVTRTYLTAVATRHDSILQEINKLFNTNKIYTDNNLSLLDLSKTIGSNRTYVSKVINSDFGMNFSAFVNSFRIAHARKMLADNPDILYTDLAEKSGFGSVKTMQRAMATPSEINTKRKKQ